MLHDPPGEDACIHFAGLTGDEAQVSGDGQTAKSLQHQDRDHRTSGANDDDVHPDS
jgi:hypothetical protein